MRGSVPLLAALVLSTSGCPSSAGDTRCSASSQCPDGFTCSLAQGLCVAAADAGAADGSGDAAVRDRAAGDSAPADATGRDRTAPADAAPGADLEPRADGHAPADHATAADGNPVFDGSATPDAAIRDAASPDAAATDVRVGVDVPGANDAGCPGLCDGRGLGLRWCSPDGSQVLRCELGAGMCAQTTVVDVCTPPGSCVESNGTVVCQPLILSFDVQPHSWKPPQGVTLTVATQHATTCWWGVTPVACNGDTPLTTTQCVVGCTALDLVACSGTACAQRSAYSVCPQSSFCTCTFFGWGDCP